MRNIDTSIFLIKNATQLNKTYRIAPRKKAPPEHNPGGIPAMAWFLSIRNFSRLPSFTSSFQQMVLAARVWWMTIEWRDARNVVTHKLSRCIAWLRSAPLRSRRIFFFQSTTCGKILSSPRYTRLPYLARLVGLSLARSICKLLNVPFPSPEGEYTLIYLDVL